MKRLSMFWVLFVFSAITLLAGRDNYGRDYSVREDSPFISPIELFGAIIILVVGYWGVMGILSLFANVENWLKGESNNKNNTKTTFKSHSTPKITNTTKVFEENDYEWQLLKEFEINPTSEKAKRISDFYLHDNSYRLYREWSAKATELKKKEEDVIKRNIKKLEKEYATKSSYSLADKISRKYEELRDNKNSIDWRIKALECKLTNSIISTEEANKLYDHYKAYKEYKKIRILIDAYGLDFYGRERIIYDCQVPHTPNWQTEELWADTEKANSTFSLLLKLADKDGLSYQGKLRIMTRIACCYALGYGVEKNLAEALRWADLREEYELKNIK